MTGQPSGFTVADLKLLTDYAALVREYYGLTAWNEQAPAIYDLAHRIDKLIPPDNVFVGGTIDNTRDRV